MLKVKLHSAQSLSKFEGGIWVPIAPVPGRLILVIFWGQILNSLKIRRVRHVN